MYNENFLGTSDVSILKFFYASFKIQQSKGNISDVGEFIDTCANTATSTVKFAKMFELLPLVPVGYSAELKRIAKFMTLRRTDVEALFGHGLNVWICIFNNQNFRMLNSLFNRFDP